LRNLNFIFNERNPVTNGRDFGGSRNEFLRNHALGSTAALLNKNLRRTVSPQVQNHLPAEKKKADSQPVRRD